MYGVSDKHTGPWLYERETPQQALEAARANWGARALYVAKIDVLNTAEMLPPVRGIVGDLRERLTERYGSGADDVFDNRKVMSALETWWESAVQVQFNNVIDAAADQHFTAASVVKKYGPTQQVKVGDFKE